MCKFNCETCKQPCVAKGSANWSELCPLIAEEKKKFDKEIEEKKALLKKVKSIPFPKNLTLGEIISLIQTDIDKMLYEK